mmetsp:Transcript_38031/g.42626  ORF Transcript_38031/g.42626 Transcript_38031/m.42626 type:complete len:139 (+) Transcript_38031:21-437(+)
MNNLANLPEGFTSINPNVSSSSSSSGNSSNEAELKKQAIQQQKQMILEQSMDAPALARLGRIKMVKPDKAASVENTIVSMAVQGKLHGKINEGKLIEILERRVMANSASTGKSGGGIQIQRKRCSLDSDEEDDDDDDI